MAGRNVALHLDLDQLGKSIAVSTGHEKWPGCAGDVDDPAFVLVSEELRKILGHDDTAFDVDLLDSISASFIRFDGN